MANIRNSQRNVSLNPMQFLIDEIIYLHPLTLPVWLIGLGWLLFPPRERPTGRLGLHS